MNLFKKLSFFAVLVASSIMPLSGVASGELVKASSGAVVCGYNFNNKNQISVWNIKNINYTGDITINDVFVDGFVNNDLQ